MDVRVAGAEVGTFADDGVGSMVDYYCPKCRKVIRPRLGAKSFVGLAHVFYALQWGVLLKTMPVMFCSELGIVK